MFVPMPINVYGYVYECTWVDSDVSKYDIMMSLSVNMMLYTSQSQHPVKKTRTLLFSIKLWFLTKKQ